MRKVTQQLIVETTREYIGVPYVHAGRSKVNGIDCVGLLACVAVDLGLNPKDTTAYGQNDVFDLMIEHIEELAYEIPRDQVQKGDIATFRHRRMWNHCGIVDIKDGNMTLIHCYMSANIGKTTEQPWDELWEKRLYKFYRYKGLR